jgi:hypothetical protein
MLIRMRGQENAWNKIFPVMFVLGTEEYLDKKRRKKKVNFNPSAG